MASEHLERRLTAILAADVAGYSRLTGLDEEGTHLQLREHLSSFVNPKIAEYRGRIVKNTGDGLLAEFSSAVDAVRCAIDVQRGMAKRNADVAAEKRIEEPSSGFRTGHALRRRSLIPERCSPSLTSRSGCRRISWDATMRSR